MKRSGTQTSIDVPSPGSGGEAGDATVPQVEVSDVSVGSPSALTLENVAKFLQAQKESANGTPSPDKKSRTRLLAEMDGAQNLSVSSVGGLANGAVDAEADDGEGDDKAGAHDVGDVDAVGGDGVSGSERGDDDDNDNEDGEDDAGTLSKLAKQKAQFAFMESNMQLVKPFTEASALSVAEWAVRSSKEAMPAINDDGRLMKDSLDDDGKKSKKDKSKKKAAAAAAASDSDGGGDDDDDLCVMAMVRGNKRF